MQSAHGSAWTARRDRHWFYRVVLLALVAMATGSGVASARAQVAGYAVTRADAQARADRFLTEWYAAWSRAPSSQDLARAAHGPQAPTASADPRSPVQPAPSYVDRLTLIPCSFRDTTSRAEWLGVSITHLYRYVIFADRAGFALCPSWMRTTPPAIGDERLNRDTVIQAADLPRIRAKRDSLIDALLAAASEFPEDQWFMDQAVRFLVDQRDTTRADSAASRCRATRWWCAALQGYVENWRGNSRPADSLFLVAVREASPEIRCAWIDLRLLLWPSERTEYGRLSCTERIRVNDALWWLGDPLWMEPGNSRRAEHFARLVEIELRAGTPQDAHYDWAPEYGGSAVREMVTRYGWPSAAFHTGTYGERRALRRPVHQQTAEYSPNRIHALPPLRLSETPFAARSSDWIVTADAASRLGSAGRIWWPPEHSPWDRGKFVQLTGEPQIAVFRRHTGLRVAAAITLAPQELGASAGDSVAGSLILSTAPERLSFGPIFTRVGGVATALAETQAGPQLLSLEVAAFGSRPVVARTRFGIDPASTWNHSPAGLSDVALLLPAADGESPPDLEVAVTSMLGSNEIQHGSRVRLYWETYGAVSDEVVFSLAIERTGRSILRKVAGFIGGSGLVTLQWTERTAALRSDSFGRPHQINVDIGRLSPGVYRLTLTARRPDGGEIGVATRQMRVTRQ